MSQFLVLLSQFVLPKYRKTAMWSITYEPVWWTFFNSYEVEKSGFFEMFNIESVFDYHPLSVYYYPLKFLFHSTITFV